MLTDAMLLSDLPVAEMCMAELGWKVKLGFGVTAAQDYLRNANAVALAAATQWGRCPRRPRATPPGYLGKDERVSDIKDVNQMYTPTYADAEAAHARITLYIHRTSVLTSSYFNDLSGAELFFKCGNFQKAGAFKVRGVSNAVCGYGGIITKCEPSTTSRQAVFAEVQATTGSRSNVWPRLIAVRGVAA